MNRRIDLKFFGIFLGFVFATPGFSQVLEEVVVTAQKREQNLQETPIAVTAFTGEYLDRAGIENVQGIGERTPGFSFSQFNRNETYLVLRGAFSNNAAPGLDSSVVMFVDEVYLGRTSDFAADLIGIERVEVLRGPQGTLFGRNVVGGAVHIITEEPGEETRAVLDATYSRFDSYNIRGKISGALTNNLYGSLTAKHEDTGGWAKNIVLDSRMGGGESTAARAKLRWEPADDLNINFAVDVLHDRGDGTPWFLIDGDPDLQPGVIRNTSAGFNDTRITQVARDESEQDAIGLSLRIEKDLSWIEGGTLTSITAWRDSSSVQATDDQPFVDASQFLGPVLSKYDSTQFSQELRLAGQTDRFTWVAGAYYLDLDTMRDEDFDAVIGLPGSLVASSFPFPLPPGFVFWTTDGIQDMNTENIALFGQATYAVTDWSNLTVGLRWSYDDKNGTVYKTSTYFPFNPIFDQPSGSVIDTVQKEDWDAFTPKFTLDVSFDDVGIFNTVFGYATVSRGYKSGGFILGPNSSASITPFNPEFVWNYEVGLKTRLWNERAQFNITYYHMDYSDLQQEIIPGRPGLAGTVNTGESEIDGIELETQIALSDNLFVALSYSYMDSQYTDLTLGGVDHKGFRLPHTPEHSYNVDARYTQALGPGELELAFNYAFRGDITYDPSEFTFDSVFGRTELGTFNLTASYMYKDWELSVWGRNLTDDRSPTTVLPFVSILYQTPEEVFSGEGYASGPTTPPRTYGVTIRKTWE